MRCGINCGVAQNRFQLARQRVDLGDAVDFVSEELHADDRIIGGRGKNFHHISPDAEFVADKVNVIALILQLYELFDQLVAGLFHARAQRNHHVAVINRVAQTVDTGNRCDDDHIAPLRQRKCGAVAQLVDFVVDGAVLFDIGIGLRNVRLGLIVVVIGDKVFYRVVGKEFLELAAELRRERFVMCEHKRRTLQTLNYVRHSERLARACYAEQSLLFIAFLNASDQRFNCLRLVACGLVFGVNLEIHSVFLHQMAFAERNIVVIRDDIVVEQTDADTTQGIGNQLGCV